MSKLSKTIFKISNLAWSGAAYILLFASTLFRFFGKWKMPVIKMKKPKTKRKGK